jgi:hypothetical protein
MLYHSLSFDSKRTVLEWMQHTVLRTQCNRKSLGQNLTPPLSAHVLKPSTHGSRLGVDVSSLQQRTSSRDRVLARKRNYRRHNITRT